MVGCIVHQTVPDGAPEQEVRINGRQVRPLLDTGSSVSLVRPQLLGTTKLGRSLLPITCVHGDTRYVPAQTVSVSAPQEPGRWKMAFSLICQCHCSWRETGLGWTNSCAGQSSPTTRKNLPDQKEDEVARLTLLQKAREWVSQPVLMLMSTLISFSRLCPEDPWVGR